MMTLLEYDAMKIKIERENEEKLKHYPILEKQLKIAVEALEFYEKPFACFHPDYNIAQHHKKAAEALVKIKELEK